MKAQELRIGNYVGLRDSEWNGFNYFFEFMENTEIKTFLEDKNKYAIVKSIATDIELMAYNVDLDYYELSEIQPILLTKEWLLKFRFKKSEEDFYSIKTGRKNVTLEICLSEQRTILFNKRLNEYIELKNIEYVHQLQNLYFALTGEEITI